jgi:hypothetical protein
VTTASTRRCNLTLPSLFQRLVHLATTTIGVGKIDSIATVLLVPKRSTEQYGRQWHALEQSKPESPRFGFPANQPPHHKHYSSTIQYVFSSKLNHFFQLFFRIATKPRPFQ